MSDEPVYDFAIIGAGITGLIIAKRLHAHNYKVIVLEKSRGLGGRIATRRVEPNLMFDHGAQFIKKSQEVEYLKSLLSSSCRLNQLSLANQDIVFVSPDGLTSIAKDLSLGLHIEKEAQVESFSNSKDTYQVHLKDSDQLIKAHHVILTAPVPQCLNLISNSGWDYLVTRDLENVQYAKALVFLVKKKCDVFFTEWSDGPIYSITSQTLKFGNTHDTATIVMSPSWSDKYFDQSDTFIINCAKRVFQEFNLDIPASDIISLKKWRYSHPVSQYHSLFVELKKGLYLSGDGFGGPSIKGAIRSAVELSNRLLQQ